MEYAETMTAKPTTTPMTTDRERVISVRVSKLEHETLQKAANDVGLTISAFLRFTALDRAKNTKQ